MRYLTPPNAGAADGPLRARAARSPAKPLPWTQDHPVIAADSDRTGMPRSAQDTQIADLARLILGSAHVADLKQMRQFCALESDGHIPPRGS
jgi:hypothetical protein